MSNLNNDLLIIFKALLEEFGPREWWPAESKLEIIISAILVQNVSWRNAVIALNNLKQSNLMNIKSLYEIDESKLASLIISSRFYNQKSKKIKYFAHYLIEEFEGNLEKFLNLESEILRTNLLKIKGIGNETADCIILYAGNKLSFPSDSYTKRIFTRYGIIPEEYKYDDIRDVFMNKLPKDIYIYNEFHALINALGSRVCKVEPECAKCPISYINSKIYCRHNNANILN